MKIVLEETLEHLKGKRRVEIEWDQDDMDIYEFKEKLLEPALLAWTYQPNTIAELFGEEEVEDNEIAKDDEYDFDDPWLSNYMRSPLSLLYLLSRLYPHDHNFLHFLDDSHNDLRSLINLNLFHSKLG